MELYEEVRADLESSIFSSLANEEAKSRNIDAQAFIAEEVTDKLRLFTDEEKASIETALLKRLFAKYTVKIALVEPAPVVQNISFDADDPQIGPASAPVTVVMFTDFQCPACSRTHPVLKRTLGRVRWTKFVSSFATSRSNEFTKTHSRRRSLQTQLRAQGKIRRIQRGALP
jgi:hypothetical protein